MLCLLFSSSWQPAKSPLWGQGPNGLAWGRIRGAGLPFVYRFGWLLTKRVLTHLKLFLNKFDAVMLSVSQLKNKLKSYVIPSLKICKMIDQSHDCSHVIPFPERGRFFTFDLTHFPGSFLGFMLPGSVFKKYVSILHALGCSWLTSLNITAWKIFHVYP